jgi:hypothetical protein
MNSSGSQLLQLPSNQPPPACLAARPVTRPCLLRPAAAGCSIPELEFEIGAGAYVPFAGDLTTVAQVLKQACKNLNMNQVGRWMGAGGEGGGGWEA